MDSRYITRSLEPVLLRASEEFPAVVLTGPRQSGKTTLLKHLFEETHRYVSLEPPDIRGAAAADPRGFMDMHPAPVIFDEIQYAPELLYYIKERVDDSRDLCGQFLLTGSQNLLLMAQITESLAGRAAVLRLLPLSRREIDGVPGAPFPWENQETPAGKSGQRPASRGAGTSPLSKNLWLSFLRGGYPELWAYPSRDGRLWHASYVQTYLERDVRLLRQVGDLTQFQSFLRAIAARCAQLLNLSEVARDLGLAVNTAKAWLSVLEATYQVLVLRPYFANVGKRLMKTPKVYFMDVGTLCYLAGLADPEHAASGPMAGAIMETAVLSEVFKTLVHRGIEPEVHFWRTSSGREVDFLVAAAGRLIPIEVKRSATPRPAMAAGIGTLRGDLGAKLGPGFVVHPGDVRVPLGSDVTALPFAEL